MAGLGTTVALIKALGATPDPAVIEQSVSDWLDDHPEATTTVEDGSITKAKLDSNLQGTVDDVSDLKNEIKSDETLKSGYIVYSTGEIKSSSSRHYLEFSVAYGMAVRYSMNDGAAYNFGIAFYDENSKYISGNIVTGAVQTITVPEKAALCRATVTTADQAILYNWPVAIKNNMVNGFKAISIDKSQFTLYNNKYAYYDRPTLADYTGLYVLEFPVYEGLQFVYSMKNSNPNSVGLHFRNATGGFVSGEQAKATPTTMITPATAVRCYATVYSISEITFLYVGNSLLNAVSNPGTVEGLTVDEYPLENLIDKTGMLDIFLNVGCIGDSLASGESYWNDGGSNEGYDFYEYSWGQYLARKTGNKYYNWSHGGLSTKQWLQSTYATECFDGDHKCEAYIIGLGQNDANYSYTIGTSSDIDLSDYNNNADTFYGSYGKIIQKIKEVQPMAKIFVVTDPNTTVDSNGYNTAIRAMATIFDNIYVIDLRQYGLKYMQSPVLIAQLRAGHFNAYGYKIFAMMIANYIDWIVTTNYTEFTQVELIGTGHSWTD